MKATLRENTPPVKPKNRLNEFPENKLGIIRSWGPHAHYVGRIVIRRGSTIYSLSDFFGDNTHNSWPRIESLCTIEQDFYIEVLPEGSVVEITV